MDRIGPWRKVLESHKNNVPNFPVDNGTQQSLPVFFRNLLGISVIGIGEEDRFLINSADTIWSTD